MPDLHEGEQITFTYKKLGKLPFRMVHAEESFVGTDDLVIEAPLHRGQVFGPRLEGKLPLASRKAEYLSTFQDNALRVDISSTFIIRLQVMPFEKLMQKGCMLRSSLRMLHRTSTYFVSSSQSLLTNDQGIGTVFKTNICGQDFTHNYNDVLLPGATVTQTSSTPFGDAKTVAHRSLDSKTITLTAQAGKLKGIPETLVFNGSTWVDVDGKVGYIINDVSAYPGLGWFDVFNGCGGGPLDPHNPNPVFATIHNFARLGNSIQGIPPDGDL